MKSLNLTEQQVIDLLSLVEEEIRYLTNEAIPSCDDEPEELATIDREGFIKSLKGMEDIKKQLSE